MRIGILTNYHLRKVGGAEAAIDRLATLWQRAGHEVLLISAPKGRGENRRPWKPTYERLDIPRPRSTRFWLGGYVTRIERAHRRRRLDILIASDVYWPGHVARLFWRKTGVPYVLWSHGSDVMHGSRFLKKPLIKKRMQKAIRDAHALACISRYMRDRLHSLARPVGIERIIPNGWPDEWATAGEPDRVVEGNYLFGMGRIVRLKGFQTLIEAYARLRPRHPDMGLIIAGTGDHRETLIARARSLDVPVTTELPPAMGKIVGACFPGVVHGETKRGLAGHATLAVCPSIRQEPMSLVLFEMLGCGVPVVASHVGGTPDIVQPGVNGDLFPAGDVDALTKRLDRLLTETPEREQLAARAAASVAPYRWSRIAEAWLDFLQDVLHGKLTTNAVCARLPHHAGELIGNERVKGSVI